MHHRFDWGPDRLTDFGERPNERTSGFQRKNVNTVSCGSMARAAVCLGLLACASEAFYVPGVTPHTFHQGEVVKIRVNKLTSAKTMLPYEFYTLVSKVLYNLAPF